MNKLDDARKKINLIDEEIAKLFEERMNASKAVAEYKLEHGLPIFDGNRENEVIKRNSALIEDETIKEYYISFLKETMNISKKYQSRIIEGIKVAYSGVEGAFAYIAAKKMFPLAIATSIDALAVGISLAMLKVNIWSSALFIGLTTFAFSFVGVRIGGLFGARHKSRAELLGGLILVAIGIRILIEHTLIA